MKSRDLKIGVIKVGLLLIWFFIRVTRVIEALLGFIRVVWGFEEWDIVGLLGLSWVKVGFLVGFL